MLSHLIVLDFTKPLDGYQTRLPVPLGYDKSSLQLHCERMETARFLEYLSLVSGLIGSYHCHQNN